MPLKPRRGRPLPRRSPSPPCAIGVTRPPPCAGSCATSASASGPSRSAWISPASRRPAPRPRRPSSASPFLPKPARCCPRPRLRGDAAERRPARRPPHRRLVRGGRAGGGRGHPPAGGGPCGLVQRRAWPGNLQQRYPPDPSGSHPIMRVLRTGKPILAPRITDEALLGATRDPEHYRLVRETWASRPTCACRSWPAGGPSARFPWCRRDRPAATGRRICSWPRNWPRRPGGG